MLPDRDQRIGQLVSALTSGSAREQGAAVGRLFSPYYEELIAFARKLARRRWAGAGSRSAAEGVVHDAYISLASSPYALVWWLRGVREDRIDNSPRLRHVLRRLVKWRFLDWSRRRERRKRFRTEVDVDTFPSRELGPAEVVAQAEETRLFWTQLEATGRRSPADRRIIELRYFDGLSYEQIAALLDVDPSKAMRRLRRAVAALRQELHAWSSPEAHPRTLRHRRATPATGPSLTVDLIPGNASEETIRQFLQALSDLNVAAGGHGLVFEVAPGDAAAGAGWRGGR